MPEPEQPSPRNEDAVPEFFSPDSYLESVSEIAKPEVTSEAWTSLIDALSKIPSYNEKPIPADASLRVHVENLLNLVTSTQSLYENLGRIFAGWAETDVENTMQKQYRSFRKLKELLDPILGNACLLARSDFDDLLDLEKDWFIKDLSTTRQVLLVHEKFLRDWIGEIKKLAKDRGLITED